MSLTSRTRRNHKYLRWQSHQTLFEQLRSRRASDDDGYVSAKLASDVYAMEFADIVMWVGVVARAQERTLSGEPMTAGDSVMRRHTDEHLAVVALLSAVPEPELHPSRAVLRRSRGRRRPAPLVSLPRERRHRRPQ